MRVDRAPGEMDQVGEEQLDHVSVLSRYDCSGSGWRYDHDGMDSSDGLQVFKEEGERKLRNRSCR